MVCEENHCCDCAVPAYPCRGNICELRHVLVYYCDKCKSEAENLWNYDGKELCEDCIRDDIWQNTIKAGNTTECRCEQCGEETECYDYEGRMLCEECIFEVAFEDLEEV